MGVLHVGELLSLPVLRGARVLAGHRGLDREVTNVNVMEVPDIEAYVHPGEVLLTTLYPLRDDLAGVADLVRRLHAATLSALVVRLGRYVDHIPAAAVDAADELGFPIIVVDTHIAFNDVISAVLAIVLADYGPEPGRAETIRERLTAVALTGGGLAEIARTLAGALDRHVTVVDAGGATLGTGRPPTEPAGAAGPGSGSFLGVPDHGRRHRTRAPARRRGHRTDARPASTDPSGLLRRGHAHRPGAGQHRAGPPDAGAAARGGGDRQQPRPRTATGAVPLVRPGISPSRTPSCWPGPPGSFRTPMSPGRRLLRCPPARWRGRGVSRRSRSCRRPVSTRSGSWRPGRIGGGRRWPAVARCDVHAAIGTVAGDADGLAASHRSARESLAIGEVTARPLVRHDELLLERILLSVDPTRLQELVSDQIGPLIEADRTGSGALCQTLETYLGIGNAAAAARALYIHYNTMKHRMVRIVELLDVDLHDPRTRLSLAVALAARALTSGAGSRG